MICKLYFNEMGRHFNPYYTRFIPELYKNFSAWPLDARLYEKRDFQRVYPHFFVNKDNVDEWEGLADLDRLTVIEVNAIVRDAIPLRSPPTAISAGPTDVRIISRPGDVLMRLDQATNAVAATIEVGDQPTAVAADGDTVWVASAGTHELVHMARDGEVLSRTELSGETTGITVDGDQVLVTLRQQ